MFSLTDFLRRTRQPAIMGIVNCTGDSFSEGAASAPDSAVERALMLIAHGADLLDLGGESTRPGSAPVTPAEEIDRIIPVLAEIKRLHPETVCSIDTRNAATARAALEAGAEIINDVSMLNNAPETADLTAKYGAGLILSHSRGTPQTMMAPEYCQYPDGVAAAVKQELSAAFAQAVAAGNKAENILLDPGFGFSKNAQQCWELLHDLAAVAPLSQMLIGVSRKTFLGALTGEKIPAQRGSETLTAEIILALQGVAMIRTHAVKDLYKALMVLTQNGDLKS